MYSQKLNYIYSSPEQVISELRGITCHMGTQCLFHTCRFRRLLFLTFALLFRTWHVVHFALSQ